MATSLNMVAPNAPAEQIVELISRDGYVIIENLAREQAAGARDELSHYLDDIPYGNNEWLGGHTKRFGNVLKRSPSARKLVINPSVMAIADQILLRHCARYQLNFSSVIHIEPGETVQTLHRDAALYPFKHPCPDVVLPTMWALTDFTAANGGTQIVPGSHLWEHERQPFEDEIINAEMPAGSLLIYLGGVWHGGGKNQSNTPRMGLSLQYSAGWLRQEENQYLSIPPEVARQFPEPLQRLIGYDFGGPFLGFVNGADPKLVLDNQIDDGVPINKHRSRADIDEAAARMTLLSLGNVKTVPTPERDGVRVNTMRGLEEAGSAD